MTLTSIWAVVTAFRPEPDLLSAVAALQGEVAGVIVVDDGSGPGFDDVLGSVAGLGAVVLRLADNSGIATSLNTGIRHALDQGCDAVVTFDQDSFVTPGFVGALVSAHERALTAGWRVGLVVPEFFAGISQVHTRAKDATLLARHSIQSGMLLERGVFSAIGFLRDELFIDLVDTEFELRCHAQGLTSVAAPGIDLAHSLGRQYERRLWGRRVSLPGIPPVVTLSTPFRYYYRVRNRIVINREFGLKFLTWTLRDSLLEFIHFASALTIARPRRALWSLYRAGLRDARRNRLGRMPDDLQRLASAIRWSAPPMD
mgnify:FL=1